MGRGMKTVWSAVRQIVSIGREAAGMSREHGLSRGLYWFLVRNVVSLRLDYNNARKSRYAMNGFRLAEDGFAELKPMSPELCDQMVNHFLKHAKVDRPVDSLGAYFEAWRGTGVVRPPGVSIAQQGELMGALLAESGLLGIVEEHLGIRRQDMLVSATIDTLVNISTQRRLVNNYDDALEIHRDIDSFKFVKVFFYLNDVVEGQGHHEVYLGSHRELPLGLRLLKRYRAEDLAAHGVPARLQKVVGSRGYGFIENTTTFHRGTVPSKGDRIILSLSFNDAHSASKLYDQGYYPLPATGSVPGAGSVRAPQPASTT